MDSSFVTVKSRYELRNPSREFRYSPPVPKFKFTIVGPWSQTSLELEHDINRRPFNVGSSDINFNFEIDPSQIDNGSHTCRVSTEIRRTKSS